MVHGRDDPAKTKVELSFALPHYTFDLLYLKDATIIHVYILILTQLVCWGFLSTRKILRWLREILY
jgi:hypothetical protein